MLENGRNQRPKRKRKTQETGTPSGSKKMKGNLKVALGNKYLLNKDDSHTTDGSTEFSTNSFKEQTIMQDVNDLCQKMEDIGKQVLVMVVGPEHSQWFGSQYGLEFARNNMDIIGGFFNFCQDKSRSPHTGSIVKIKMKPDGSAMDSSTDIEEDMEDLYTAVKIEEEADDAIEVVIDEDYNPAEDSGDDDNVGDDNYGAWEDDDRDDVNGDYDEDTETKSKKRKGQVVDDSDIEKFFDEIAEGIASNEDTFNVSTLLMKSVIPGGATPAIFTVGELNRGKYECTACGYKFLWKCHFVTHQIKNPYCSNVKNFKMSKEDVLEESITFESPDTGVQVTSTFRDLINSETVHPYSCAICKKGPFRDRTMFTRHVVTHNRAKTYKCNICCSGFSNIVHLSSHLKAHFRKPFQCQKCTLSFTTEKKLEQHVVGGCQSVSLLKKEKKPLEDFFEMTEIKCQLCSESILGIVELRKHLLLQHDVQRGDFDCALCKEEFIDNHSYTKHLKTHKISRCAYCPKRFYPKAALYYNHVKSHQKEKEEMNVLICDVCGEQFSKRRYFNNHIRKHTGERPFVCKEPGCGKGFRGSDGLDQHKWVHCNQHFLCDFCGRKFKKPSLLRNHRRSHTVDWRYPCIFCPEKYRKLRHFKSHLARNHPTCVREVFEKYKIVLHPCPLCPKVFHDKEDHTAHVNRHNGIKPFKCDHCGKCFNDKSNLLQHKISHQGGKRLKCTWCTRRFNEEKFLQLHIERKHTGTQLFVNQNPTGSDSSDDDADELREKTLQIIDETIRGNASFEESE